MAQEKLMRLIREKQILSDGYTVEEMEIFIKGFCSDKLNPKPKTARALGFVRIMHEGQKRDDGRDYIYHPLWMAYMAICLGLTDDTLVAITLLHDICEDTKADSAEDLPFSDSVNNGVRLMTYTPPQTAKTRPKPKLITMTN